MTTRLITAHAIDRYRQRVQRVSEAEAVEAMLTPAVKAMCRFVGRGEGYVRLATGHRLTIRDGVVVTVLPAENYKRTVRRCGRGRFG